MLYAYFDAGGTHSESPTLSVAGYVWSFENWKRANRRWQRFLSDNGLEFFHMTDFEAYEGPYKRWTPKRHLAVIKRLIKIITETASLGVAVGIASEHHANVLAQAPPDTILSTAYLQASAACMATVARWIRDQRLSESVSYIFESGDEKQSILRRCVMAACESPTYRQNLRVRSLHFEDKRTTPALQAADILAYEYAKEAPRRLGLASRPQRKSLIALANALPHRGKFLDWESLSHSVAHIQNPSAELAALRRQVRAELGDPIP